MARKKFGDRLKNAVTFGKKNFGRIMAGVYTMGASELVRAEAKQLDKNPFLHKMLVGGKSFALRNLNKLKRKR